VAVSGKIIYKSIQLEDYEREGRKGATQSSLGASLAFKARVQRMCSSRVSMRKTSTSFSPYSRAQRWRSIDRAGLEY
jgi:hypothetical protein